MMTCVMCQKAKKTVEMQPTRKQLLFGGWHMRHEPRCQACETKVVKWLERLIATNLGTDKPPRSRPKACLHPR